MLLFGSAFVYGATAELGFSEIAAATAQQGLGRRPLPAGRPRDDRRRARVQGLGRAVPHVDARRLRGRADTRHGVHGGGHEGGGTRAHAPSARDAAFPGEAELWTIALAVIACVSLAVGNLAAIVQTSVKRLLAYSSIAQAGFMLIPVASGQRDGGTALLFYLIPYGAASLGAFAVVAAGSASSGGRRRSSRWAAWAGSGPLLGGAMWVFMLSFAGLPLTGGFVAKFYAFASAWDRGWTWLIVVGVIATALSLYYYLAVIRAMYMRPGLPLASPGGRPAAARARALGCRSVVRRRRRRLVLRRRAAYRSRAGRGASLSFPY